MHPLGQWAENKSNIYLTLLVSKSKIFSIELFSNKIIFSSTNIVGVHYNMELELLGLINEKESSYKQIDKGFIFCLKKQESVFWNYLQKGNGRPHWLSIDWEKWKTFEDENENFINEYPKMDK